MRRRSDITSTMAPVVVVLLLTFAFGGAALLAHHGWTGYQEKETQLSGTITKASYENPHGQVDLNVDGKRWQIVLAPPSRLQARGLDREMLKVGSQATVVGYIHKTTPTELRAERITIDGKTTELR